MAAQVTYFLLRDFVIIKYVCTRNYEVKNTSRRSSSCDYIFVLQCSKVNMIITDYCMPGMTGYELLKKIKVLSHYVSFRP